MSERKSCNKVTAKDVKRKLNRQHPEETVHQKMFMASLKGDVNSVLEFAAKGGNVNYLSLGNGASMLFNACRQDNIPIIECLIVLGVDVNQKLSIRYFAPPKKDRDVTAFHFVRSAEAVELLWHAQGDFNAIDAQGNTPLMAAAWCRYPRAVKKLREIGADLRIKNKKGKTALDIARERLIFWETSELGKNIDCKASTKIINECSEILSALEDAQP